MGPFVAVQMTVVLVAMDGSPAVVTLLCAYAYKTTDAFAFCTTSEPRGKEQLEVIIPEFFGVEWEIFLRIAVGRLFPDPQILHLFIPRAPVWLVHRCAGSDFERYAAVIYIEDIAVGFQGAEYILRSLTILYLIVHMEDSEAAVGSILADIVYAEIQKDTAILAS